MSIEAMKLALEALNKNVGELRVAGARHILKTAIAAAEKQEPDYWLGYGLQAHEEKPFENATALYTTPPAAQRQWVDLTDEEIKHLWETRVGQPCPSYPFEESDWSQFAQAIKAKLKEKNT